MIKKSFIHLPRQDVNEHSMSSGKVSLVSQESTHEGYWQNMATLLGKSSTISQTEGLRLHSTHLATSGLLERAWKPSANFSLVVVASLALSWCIEVLHNETQGEVLDGGVVQDGDVAQDGGVVQDGEVHDDGSHDGNGSACAQPRVCRSESYVRNCSSDYRRWT